MKRFLGFRSFNLQGNPKLTNFRSIRLSSTNFEEVEAEEEAKKAYLQSVSDPTGEYHPEFVRKEPVQENNTDQTQDPVYEDDLSVSAHKQAMSVFRS